MTTIFSYKRNSYSFSDVEKNILLKLLNFFKYEIPNGNGSYLMMLDLDDIDFRWSPTMALNDDGVFGSWTFGSSNTVFIRPSEFSRSLYDKICSSDFKPKRNEIEHIECIKSIFSKFSNSELLNDPHINQDILNFILYLIENDGMILSTVFHELYHKWQYKSCKPLYILNSFAFSLLGYERSIKSKYSIEGDVRIYVDCPALHNAISDFHNLFFQYANGMKTIMKYEDEYNRIKNLNSKDNNSNHIVYKYENAKDVLNSLKNKDRFELAVELFNLIKCI